ncbi:amino acid ABC transporter permease [Xylanimonas allomyrinae]|uniref:Amino acid ABC transporter permease n=1 Tax=Xylanimonas allomyrinae TaxID=2509459 RepID=A0A4P6ELG8_9MICO|nr:amino acid ABC transporter permease [Xylanimonas allomyrinae]QAY63106.1 amino acid ABC transporter permease [Xylanimonas allomyrinae]
MNWHIVADYVPQYGRAVLVVLRLAAIAIAGSLAVGIAAALVRHHRVPGAARLVAVYVEVSRNTPSMVQLYFLYFGLPLVGVKADGFTCAAVGLVFLGGSYMAEALRSGLEAVRKGQLDAAASLGLSPRQTLLRVTLPQAFAVALPALTANAIFLVKETSIVSVIAVVDLMALTQNLVSMFYTSNEAYLLLVASYLVILLPLSVALRLLERRVRHASFGS